MNRHDLYCGDACTKHPTQLLILVNHLWFPFDREVRLGKPRHDLINTRFCVIESYGHFVSEWIRIVLKNTRDFLQGITYPARSDLSLASRNHHSDYSFRCKKGL
jgi:hypothetical protein